MTVIPIGVRPSAELSDGGPRAELKVHAVAREIFDLQVAAAALSR